MTYITNFFFFFLGGGEGFPAFSILLYSRKPILMIKAPYILEFTGLCCNTYGTGFRIQGSRPQGVTRCSRSRDPPVSLGQHMSSSLNEGPFFGP